MRRLLSVGLLLFVVWMAPCAWAEHNREYSLPQKHYTVLQNVPDRNLTPLRKATIHQTVPVESPVTGLPWDGDYQPVLVQISNAVGTVKQKGGTVKAAGIGKRAPWGIQYADILYEMLLVKSGETRFTALFSDCFAQGQPASGVGPVRSTRIGQLLLREEWSAGFVFSGGYFVSSGRRDQDIDGQIAKIGTPEQGVLFNVQQIRPESLRNRVMGKKAPDNLNVDIVGIRALIPAAYVSKPRPFLFADECPYAAAYEPAEVIHVDWGQKTTISHFVYDKNSQTYQRYCGPGVNKAKWSPFTALDSPEDQVSESQQPLAFANLIIQRVLYEYEDEIFLMPNMQVIGKGNADIFIGGRFIPGYWVRDFITGPTVFYDDQGRELMLNRGKTIIAQFPQEGLCTFASGLE